MKKAMLFIALSMFMFSCNTLRVVSDYDKTIDFNDYHSIEFFGWAQSSDSILNRFDKEKIERSFGQEFSKREYNLVEKGKGDLIVSLHIITENKVQKSATTTPMYGYGGYYGYGPRYRWGTGFSTTTIHEYEYTVGTLVISVYDAKKQVLIWESAGSATIEWGSKNNERTIDYVVSRIMKKYPKKA